MAPIVIACGGFLIAVLWMDLMFDVQVLRHRGSAAPLPEEILVSIAAYYRRATTDAQPMSALIGVVMVVAIVVLLRQIGSVETRWLGIISLLFCGPAVGLAAVRVVPNAVRLGSRRDPAAVQSSLARAICRDHLFCLACVSAVVILQLSPA